MYKILLFGIIFILCLVIISIIIILLIFLISRYVIRHKCHYIIQDNDYEYNNNINNNSNIENKEVFYINYGPKYSFSSKREAEQACKELGATLANNEQLLLAQRRGACWCAYGWIEHKTDGSAQGYPMNEEYSQKCEGKTGVVLKSSYSLNLNPYAGAICYGIRPNNHIGILPFNPKKK